MTYTGPLVSFDIYDEDGNVIFTINYINWCGNNCSAISFHGNGKVRQGNTDPFKNLVSRRVGNPGKTQQNFDFTLN